MTCHLSKTDISTLQVSSKPRKLLQCVCNTWSTRMNAQRVSIKFKRQMMWFCITYKLKHSARRYMYSERNLKTRILLLWVRKVHYTRWILSKSATTCLGLMGVSREPHCSKTSHVLSYSPKCSHITDLIIDHFHTLSGHSGRGMTLNAIRQTGL